MNMSVFKKWWKVSLLLFLALFMVLFRHEIFQFSVKTYLNISFPCQTKWVFSYEKADWQQRKLVFTDVLLATETGSCALHADHLDLGVKRSFPKMFISNLSIVLDARNGKESFSLFSIVNGFLSRWMVDIDQGKGELIDEKSSTSVYFSFMSGTRKGSLGRLALSSDSSFMKTSDVGVQIYSWPKEVIMEVDLQEGDLPWISNVVSFFSEPSDFFTHVTGGEIDGRLWIGFYPDGVVSQVNAAIVVQDFHAVNRDKYMETHLYNMQMEINYPTGKRDQNIRERFAPQNCVFKSFIKGGLIHYKDPDGANEYALSDLHGPIQFNSFQDSEIHLQGYLDQKGHLSPILLLGHPSLLDPNTLDLDLKLFLDAGEENITKLGISITAENDHSFGVKAHVEDLSKEQIGVIQHVIGLGFEPINDVQIADGSLTIEVGALIERGRLTEFRIDQLVADHLQIYWKSADLLGFCAKCTLKADFDMDREDPFAVPDMAISILHGDIIMGRAGGESLSISDIDIDVAIEKGAFLPSKWTANVFGAWTELLISGPYTDADLAVKCRMNRDWMVAYLLKGQEPLSTSLEEVSTSLMFHRQKGYWNVLGKSEFIHPKEEKEEITFGFFLTDDIFGFEGKDLFALYQRAVAQGWFQTQSLSGRSVNFFTDRLEPKIWMGDLLVAEGKFDPQGLYLKMDMKSSKCATSTHELSLNHAGQLYYDFTKGQWKGSLSIEKGVLHEKEHSLELQDIAAELNFENNIFDLDHLSVESEGMLLQGRARFVLAEEGFQSFLIEADHIEGSSLQLEKLLHHFDQQWTLPFDGKIESLPQGVRISGRKEGEELQLDWDMACRLTHGSLAIDELFQVEDFRFDLLCNSVDREVHLIDIRGRLPSKEGKMYHLYGKELKVGFGEHPFLSCDLRLQSATMDLIRLMAMGTYDGNKKHWNIKLDEEKSHFLNEKFQSTRCFFSPTKGFYFAEGTTEFSLASLPTLVHFGIGTELLTKKALDGKVKIAFLKDEKGMKISLAGHDLDIGSRHFNDVNFGIEKRGDIWKIHRFNLDDLFIQAKLIQGPDKIDISDLALLCKDTRLFVEKGVYSFAKEELHLPIESMMIDLEQVGKLFNGPSALNGVCHVTGNLYASISSLGGDIAITSPGLYQDEYVLETIKPIRFVYGLEEGLSLLEGNLLIQGKKAPERSFSLNCQGATIKDQKKVVVEGLLVTASNEAIEYGIHSLGPVSRHFPYFWQGSTECLLTLVLDGSDYKLTGKLPEGYYHILNHYRHIKECSFEYTPKSIDLKVKVPMVHGAISIESHTIPEAPYQTEIKMKKGKDETVECRLSLATAEGLIVHHLQGNMCGLDFSFLPKPKMNDAQALTFLGTVKIHGGRLAPYVGGMLKDFKLGKGYEVGGEFTFFKEHPENSFFEGYVKGKNFHLSGSELTTMFGHVKMNKGELIVENLTVSDEAINVTIPKIHGVGGQIQIPEIIIRNFRPSLMRKVKHSPLRLKPFCIDQMTFQDITGSIGDLNSFTGKGSLIFQNTFKRDHQPINIPIELISRLGLDMVLLVPIHGEMDYVIKNGKLVFTKLRNSYSEGKRSHFYLSTKKESFVDLTGNIQMQIKMKQYVLFKITELFVLTVAGTLDDPHFALK